MCVMKKKQKMCKNKMGVYLCEFVRYIKQLDILSVGGDLGTNFRN